MRVTIVSAPPEVARFHGFAPATSSLERALLRPLRQVEDVTVTPVRLGARIPGPDGLVVLQGAVPADDARTARRGDAPWYGASTRNTAALIKDLRAAAEQLVEAVAASDVVYALDPFAAGAALAARDRVAMAGGRRCGVVIRVKACGLALNDNPVWTAVLRAADAFTVTTSRDREALRRRGVDGGRIVPCGDSVLVAGDLLGPPTTDRRTRPGMDDPGDNTYALMLTAPPESPLVSRCLVRALARSPELRLIWTPMLEPGAGSDSRYFGELSTRAGVASRIERRAALDPSALTALVDGSRAVISVHPDPTGGEEALVAMMRARAVIAFDSSGSEETVVDGVTGRLIRGRDEDSIVGTIAQDWSDDFSMLSWGQAGLDRVRARFDAAGVTRDVLAALHEAA